MSRQVSASSGLHLQIPSGLPTACQRPIYIACDRFKWTWRWMLNTNRTCSRTKHKQQGQSMYRTARVGVVPDVRNEYNKHATAIRKDKHNNKQTTRTMTTTTTTFADRSNARPPGTDQQYNADVNNLGAIPNTCPARTRPTSITDLIGGVLYNNTSYKNTHAN